MSQQKLSLRSCRCCTYWTKSLNQFEYIQRIRENHAQRKETYKNDVSANGEYDNEVKTVKKKKKNQAEIVELKSTVTGIKNKKKKSLK